MIGNPPYFNVDATWGRKDVRLELLKTFYSDVQTDKTDVYYYFSRRAAELSRNRVGFILSRAFMEAFKARKLRDRILDLMNVELLFDFVGIMCSKALGSRQLF